MKEEIWQRRASLLFCAVVGLVFASAVFAYAKGPLVAAAFSFFVATAVQAPAKKLSRWTRIPQRACAVLLVLVWFLLFGLALGIGAVRLWEELRDALVWLSQNREEMLHEIEGRLGILLARDEGAVAVSERLSAWLLDAAGQAGTFFGAWLGGALRSTPKMIMLAGATLLSCVYLGMDYEKVGRACLRLIPAEHRARALAWRKRVVSTVADYCRAYLFLMFLTFFVALLGMMILGQPMALLIAFLIALVDVLPILGAGTVLIPWGLLSLAGGNMAFGIGLLILYGVIAVVRQLAEPHLIGGSLGLHPLVSMGAMLLGFWFLGGFGMVIAPLLAVLLREWLFYHARGNEEK